MNHEDAAACLWEYFRWLTGKDEEFKWTRGQLAKACELAGRTLDNEPAGRRKYCDGCIHFVPQEGEAPKDFDSRLLCLKGLESWFVLPESDPHDGGFYRPGCPHYCEEGASCEWRPPPLWRKPSKLEALPPPEA